MMIAKKILLVCFILLLAFILFIAGFYFGISYQRFIADSYLLSTNGINQSILDNFYGILKSSNIDMLKEANMSFRIQGRIVRLDKNAHVLQTADGNENSNIFFLSIKDEKTGKIVNIFNEPDKKLNDIKIWSKVKPDTLPSLISINELKKGDLIEIVETADLAGERFTRRDIYRLEKAK